MNLTITPNKLNGEITAPPSKSFAHRNIILACLSNSKVVVKNIGNSADIKATIGCMQALGANCETDGNDLICHSFSKRESAVLDCGESGSTLRFLLPICSALGVKGKFVGSEKLLSRPSKALVDTLNLMGADINDFTVNGKLKSGNYKIDGSISSQYVSGLLMALPFIEGESKIEIIGKTVSEPYIDITIDVLNEFGIKWVKDKNVFTLTDCKTVTPKQIDTEGDFSGSAFMLSAGVIGGKVSVKGLTENSVQGDAEIIDILRAFGGDLRVKGGVVTARKGELNGVEIDCENIPDLVQIISVVGCFARGKTVLSNINRLRFKESDRITAITKMLDTAKIEYELSDNGLTIYGGKVYGGVFDSGNDHRSAMSASILATFAQGESQIINAQAVEKSYPDFYKDYKFLGGKLNVNV